MTKVLVVDDERPLAKALELKLSREGYETTVAFNGEEAIETLSKGSFDLIRLDLVMPKVDGFQVLADINKQAYKLKVIVTSNLGQEEDADCEQRHLVRPHANKQEAPWAGSPRDQCSAARSGWLVG